PTNALLYRPHTFEVVIFTHFGAEDMDDDIARIHQRPIALGGAVHRPAAITFFLEAARQMFGDGHDMAAGTARGDHHRVTQRRTASQIDGHNIFGLVIFERVADALQKLG